MGQPPAGGDRWPARSGPDAAAESGERWRGAPDETHDMTGEMLAEWLRRQGHRIVRTTSSFWYNQGPRVYQAFPHHWCIRPSDAELRELLKGERAIALRYSTPLDAACGKISYHVTYEESSYGLETLRGNARSNVQRGLRRCQIERISMERLAAEGWRLQRHTLERQGRVGSVDRQRWQRLSMAAKDLPGFEAWGAIVDANLAATILTACIEGMCYMFYPQSDRRYFTSHVNNALAYSVTREMLTRPGIQGVFYGLHSLDAPPSVDEFKFRMGYRAKPVRQRVVFHPWVRPLCNRISHAVVKRFLRPGRPGLAKGEGMLRFYLEGRWPAEEQRWPACFGQDRAALLETWKGGAPGGSNC